MACGDKLTNGWGLFDMHGNVSELCEDLYDPSGVFRVLRGGSCRYDAATGRAATRGTNVPARRNAFDGLRLALSPSIQSPEAEGVSKDKTPSHFHS